MKLLLILAPLTIDCSSVDQCTRLCEFDGPAVCTGGSWTKDGGVCHAYLHGGSRGDYCYHTAATRGTCPASGRPVSASEVDLLIARRGQPGFQAVSLSPQATQPSPTITSPLSENSSDSLMTAIALLPSRYSSFTDFYGDADLSASVVSTIDRFTDSESPMRRWLLARGEDLLRVAESNISQRPVLVRPFLILVGHICSLSTTNCGEFIDEAGISNFLSAHSDAICRFITQQHRGTFRRYGVHSASRLVNGFVAPLVKVLPSLMDTAETRVIVFEHRMFQHRSRPGGPELSHFYVSVPRASAFVASVDVILSSLATRISSFEAVFAGESVYGPAATRDWFTEVTQGIIHSGLSLFRQRLSEQPNYMELSPSALDQANHETMYRATGRFFGLALQRLNPIGLSFPLIFYAKLLAQELVLEDIREDEPTLFRSLTYINTLDSDEDLASYEITIDGEVCQFTLSNRSHLIKRKINSLIEPAVRGNMNLIVNGFREVVPLSTLDGFTPQNLREMMVGDSAFDVDDMMRHVRLEGYSRTSPQIQWFERLLRDLSNEDRRKFLRFCLGTTQVPAGGFGALANPLTISRFGSVDSLPTVGTCAQSFRLPEYASEEDLRRKVTMAING